MEAGSPMKRRLFSWGILIVLAYSLVACTITRGPVVNRNPVSKIRVVMDNNYPPYAFVDNQGNMQGILIDQWKKWEEVTGVDVEITGLPWGEALERMQAGDFDVIDTVFYTTDRAQVFDFTEPYARIDVRIFFQNNISGIADASNLKGFRVAVKKGDANVDYLIAQDIRSLVYYDSYEGIIQAAAKREETIFVIDQPPALYFLYKAGIQDEFNYSEPLYGGEFHRAVIKGNSTILDLVNEGFSNISVAEFRSIDRRWLGAQQTSELERIFPYLGLGSGFTLLIIVVLIAFNRTLHNNVHHRTQELQVALSSLQENRKFLADLIENSGALVFVKDREGRYELINRKWEEVTGSKREEVIGQTDETLFPGANGIQFRKNDQEVLALNRLVEVEEIFDRGQVKRHFISIKFPLHDNNGTIKGVCGMSTEITDRKQAEAALKESENKHRLLFETANDCIFTIKDGRIVDCNLMMLTMFGYQREEILGKTPHELSPENQPDGRNSHEKAQEKINAALNGKPQFFEWQHLRYDGTCFDVEVSLNLLQLESGDFLQAIIRDITQRKRDEEKLLESKERYQTLFEESPVPLLEEDFSKVKTYVDVLRQSGVRDFGKYFNEHPEEVKLCLELVQVLDVNQAALNWYKTKDKAKLCVSLSELVNLEDPSGFIKELLDLIQGKRRYQYEIARITKTGSPLNMIVNGHVAPGHEETWGKVLISILDVTAHRRTEKELDQQINRLGALRAIDQAIIANVDIDVTLDLLASETIKQLGVDAAAILLLDQQTQRLNYATSQGFFTEALKYTRLEIGQGLAGQAAQQRKIVNITNLQGLTGYPALSHAIAAENFVTYFGVPLIVNDQLRGVLEVFHRTPLTPSQDWLSFLEILAGQAAISIENTMLLSSLQASKENLEAAYDATLYGWSRALDLRDRETEGHTRRVTEMTILLAQKLGLSEEARLHIRRGALLHDIGKMGIPDSILNKPGELTAEEWKVMRRHPVYAYEMLSPILYLQPSLDIPYCHHECWDGTGYPRGLKGEEIPLPARIFAVIDVWDALRSDRPYRKAWPKSEVIEYMRKESGKQFDPEIVNIFLHLMEKGEI